MLKFHVIAAVCFLIGLFLISHLLRERRAPGTTAAWLLLIILLPLIGVPLYFLIGVRKIRKIGKVKRRMYQDVPYKGVPEEILPIERLLVASGARPKSSGNRMEILEDGQKAYRALFETLEGATQRIHVATFILCLDEVGRSLVGLLERKARAGVEVRLLLDGVGSFWTFGWRLRRLKQAGGKVSFFLPLIHVPFFGHSNLRNHRKIVVVDDDQAIIGGMNLAAEYMGSDAADKRWVDVSFRFRGALARDLDEIFREDWRFASGEELRPGKETPLKFEDGEVVQAAASGPDVDGDPLYDSIATAIFNAKSRIWIATPYFIPDETLSKALELAVKQGVDVRILLPRKSNHRLADLCRGSYVRLLELAGAKIFLLDRMMHAKAVIVDDGYCLLGSANLDMRSLLVNFEVGCFVYSSSGIEGVSRWFESLTNRARLGVARNAFGSELLEGVGRIVGPVL